MTRLRQSYGMAYLSAQIRKNALSQRSVVVDSLTHSLIALLEPLGADPNQMFATVTEDWSGASEGARMTGASMLYTTFKLFGNAWFQQRQGTLDREQWESWNLHIRVYYYHRRGVKIWWPLRRTMCAAGFRDYLEKTEPVKDLPPISELIRGKA